MNNDELITKLENKLEKISDHLRSIDITLASQHVTLEEHIKRTKQLEERVDPIEKSVLMFHGFIKFIGMPITLLTTIAAITEILTYFRR